MKINGQTVPQKSVHLGKYSLLPVGCNRHTLPSNDTLDDNLKHMCG